MCYDQNFSKFIFFLEMKKWSFVLLFVLSYVCVSDSISATTSYLDKVDLENLEYVIVTGFNSKDVSTLHYSVLGCAALKKPFPEIPGVCKSLLEGVKNGKASVEVLYQVTTAWKALDKCPGALPVVNIVKTVNDLLATPLSIQDTFYAVSVLQTLGQKIPDVKKIVNNLQAAIKKDDSLSNFGYLFHVASQLGIDGEFAFDRIEDAVVQADEVDSVNLQFEGGLSVTGTILSGAYKLASSLNKPPPITHDQAVKFANYLVSRKTVQSPKGVWILLDALKTLTTNKFHLPVAITLSSYTTVNQKDPWVNAKITSVLGEDLGALMVVADSITRVADNVVIGSKAKFIPTEVKGVYALNLMSQKPERGLYKISVSASLVKPDPRVPGHITSSLTVKVTTTARVEYIDIGTADIQQTTISKLERVQFPNKLNKVLEMDTQQKLVIKLNIQDEISKQLLEVQQCFIRFYNAEHDVETIFVIEHDSSLQYKFDLPLGAKASDFEYKSGQYTMELIIGDVTISSSFSWLIGQISLRFSGDYSYTSHHRLYHTKPEITHLFREAERRPPLLVSNVFTVLILVPLLLLFILWLKIGINVSNLPLSISAISFHVGFAGILLLFGWFWFELNMFQTVKYLLPIATFTFLSGNRLLRFYANQHTKSVKSH